MVIDLWKTDPQTEYLSYGKLLAKIKERKVQENWALSEKRLKSILKEFNLVPAGLAPTSAGFAKSVKYKAETEVELPAGIRLENTKRRGRGLYASRQFSSGETLWLEKPLVIAADCADIGSMRTGSLCSYCGTIIRLSSTRQVVRPCVGCKACQSNWCSQACKEDDIVHAETRHGATASTKNSLKKLSIDVQSWRKFEDFVVETNWFAALLYGNMLLRKLKNGLASDYARAIDGLAYVNQEVRQESVCDRVSLQFEQTELMWKRGHQLLAQAVSPAYKLSYTEFLLGIGCVNINNNSSRIFEKYSNINHNCNPNVMVKPVVTKNDSMTIVACRDIAANEELVTTYVNPTLSVGQRRAELLSWGFLCNCDRCKREAAT